MEIVKEFVHFQCEYCGSEYKKKMVIEEDGFIICPKCQSQSFNWEDKQEMEQGMASPQLSTKLRIENIIENNFEELFVKVSQEFELKHGDWSPCQDHKFDDVKRDIYSLLKEFVKNNQY